MLALEAMGAGIQAGTPHRVLVLGRCMPEHAGDELVGAQMQRLALLVAVIGIGGGAFALVPRDDGRSWLAALIATSTNSRAPRLSMGGG